MTVLGHTTEDPISVALETGYRRFYSPFGVEGLARVQGPKLEILAIAATLPHQGLFRAFITKAKEEFQIICIWEVWNEFLPAVLVRYGFHPITQLDPVTCEITSGFKWTK